MRERSQAASRSCRARRRCGSCSPSWGRCSSSAGCAGAGGDDDRRLVVVLGYSDGGPRRPRTRSARRGSRRAAELATADDVVVLSGWARCTAHARGGGADARGVAGRCTRGRRRPRRADDRREPRERAQRRAPRRRETRSWSSPRRGTRRARRRRCGGSSGTPASRSRLDVAAGRLAARTLRELGCGRCCRSSCGTRAGRAGDREQRPATGRMPARRYATSTWIRCFASRNGPPHAPARTASISARIDSAVSACVSAPMSRPHGPWIRASFSSLDAGLEQALAATLLVAARAERADVEGLGLERCDQRRLVELVVVREHDDRGLVVGRDLGDRLLGPLRRSGGRRTGCAPGVRNVARASATIAVQPRSFAPRAAPPPCRPRRRRAAAAAARTTRRRPSRRRPRAAGSGRGGRARRTARAPRRARRRRASRRPRRRATFAPTPSPSTTVKSTARPPSCRAPRGARAASLDRAPRRRRSRRRTAGRRSRPCRR